jgi:hypothetical protein
MDELNNLSAEELVEGGFCDVVRLFVKNEPHSASKIEQGRFRLISSVSLVDQIVERLLFSRQNHKEIDNWTVIPSKPGIGLDLDEQTEAVWKHVRKLAGPATVASSDASGWDWSVQGWELEAEAEMRIALADTTGGIFADLVRKRFRCLSLSVFYLSDGRMFAQTIPGVMKSGSYVTGSSNSRIRKLASDLVGAEWCISMGDDAVEAVVKDAVAKYEQLGHSIKGYDIDFTFEFCSHIFTGGPVVIPTNWGKSLYRLLSKRYDPVEQDQYEQLLRYAPHLVERSRWLMRRVGWGPENLEGEDHGQEEPEC